MVPMQPATSAALLSEISLSGLRLMHIAVILAVAMPGALIAGFYIGSARRKRLYQSEADIDRIVGETTQAAFLALVGL